MIILNNVSVLCYFTIQFKLRAVSRELWVKNEKEKYAMKGVGGRIN